MNASPDRNPDLLDDVFNLENDYYTEGYQLGVSDAAHSGRIEGRVFGLEKGFEKSLALGRLAGRTALWDGRRTANVEGDGEVSTGNERLGKHINRLKTLMDFDTLSTENSEDAVADFDERLKDATVKAKLVSRLFAEDGLSSGSDGQSQQGERKALRVKDDDNRKQKGASEMEDFVGLPNTRRKKSDGG